MIPSSFFQESMELALVKEGLDIDKEKALALGLPAGVAAATFGVMRRKSLAPASSLLGQIQRKSKGRMARVLPVEWRSGDPGKAHKVIPWWGRGKMQGLVERLVDRVMYGGPVFYSKGNKLYNTAGRVVGTPGKPAKFDGAVWHYNPQDKKLIEGTVSPTALAGKKEIALLEDKYIQAKMLEKNLPGAMPRTELLPKAKAPGELEATLKKDFPKGFLVKKRLGTANSEGVTFDKDLTPAKLKEFLATPKDYLVQEKMPLLSEFRLHAIGGKVIPGASTRRFMGSKGSKAQLKEAIRLTEEVSKSLPHGLDKAMIGPDIAVLRGPGGKLKAQVIEINVLGKPAGQSGFVDWYINPTAPHAFNKALTGQHSRTLSGAAATVTGTGAAAGTQVYQKRKK